MKAENVVLFFSALLAIAVPATAQPLIPLSSKELVSTIVGKKVEHMRLSDKRVFVWDVKESGALFIQNSTLKGQWALNDKGEFCVKWAVAQVPDQCYFFYRTDGLSAGPSSTPGKITSKINSVS